MEEAGQAQVGVEDHHGEKQDEGVHVEGGVGLGQADSADSNEGGGTNEGDGGPIHAQTGKTADSDPCQNHNDQQQSEPVRP